MLNLLTNEFLGYCDVAARNADSHNTDCFESIEISDLSDSSCDRIEYLSNARQWAHKYLATNWHAAMIQAY